jgi:hypothetical protein
MTSDVAKRPVSPGSGEGQRIRGTRGREKSGRPIIARALPDLWLMIAGSSRSAAYAYGAILGGLGPDWLELDVWLARSLLRYAARNLSIENTVRRDRR